MTVNTRIFPTPFSTVLVVDKNVTTCSVKMDLYNALGQLLMRGITINDGRNDIPLSRLPAAVYFYKFYADGKELLTGKIMKQ